MPREFLIGSTIELSEHDINEICVTTDVMVDAMVRRPSGRLRRRWRWWFQVELPCLFRLMCLF